MYHIKHTHKNCFISITQNILYTQRKIFLYVSYDKYTKGNLFKYHITYTHIKIFFKYHMTYTYRKMFIFICVTWHSLYINTLKSVSLEIVWHKLQYKYTLQKGSINTHDTNFIETCSEVFLLISHNKHIILYILYIYQRR